MLFPADLSTTCSRPPFAWARYRSRTRTIRCRNMPFFNSSWLLRFTLHCASAFRPKQLHRITNGWSDCSYVPETGSSQGPATVPGSRTLESSVVRLKMSKLTTPRCLDGVPGWFSTQSPAEEPSVQIVLETRFTTTRCEAPTIKPFRPLSQPCWALLKRPLSTPCRRLPSNRTPQQGIWCVTRSVPRH